MARRRKGKRVGSKGSARARSTARRAVRSVSGRKRSSVAKPRSVNARASGKVRKPKRTARPAPISRRKLPELERSIRAVGEQNLRRGPIRISKASAPIKAERTGRLTPTKRGLGVVKKHLSHVASLQQGAIRKRRGKAPVFSYDLEIRFRGKDGEFKTSKVSRVGVPRLKDIKRRKGETPHQALKRATLDQIRETVHGVVRAEWKIGESNFKENAEKYGYKRARAMLRKFKETRETSFRVTFNREV